MVLPTPAFPGADFDGNEQNTGADGAVDTTLGQAADYNEATAEALEVQRLLRGKVAQAHGGAVLPAINKTGGALALTTPLALKSNGFDATTGLLSPVVAVADADSYRDSAGLLAMEKGGDAGPTESVADDAAAFILRDGFIYGVDTSAWVAGNFLWLAAAGALSTTAIAGCPPIAQVDTVSATLGVLKVFFSGLASIHMQHLHAMYNSVISPAGLVAQANDYAPTGIATAGTLLLTSDAAYDITGIVAPAVQAQGKELKVINLNAANALTLTDEDAQSAAANRMALGASIALGHDEGATLIYDATNSRWRCVGRSN